jgi:hypothetical protein
MYKLWTIFALVLVGCAELTTLADAEPEDVAVSDGAPADSGRDAQDARVLAFDGDAGVLDAWAGDANALTPDAAQDGAMDSEVVTDGAVADADTSADGGGIDPDAGPDPDPDGGPPDAGAPDAGPMWVPGALRPRPPVVYVGAPAGCPLPSGPLRTQPYTDAMYSPIVVMDRWTEPCSPGLVYTHSVPDSIASWCLAELEAATTCAGLARAVADCRSCGDAWVDTVIDAGCPLDQDLSAPAPSEGAACADIEAIRREGECRAACPYNTTPPRVVADWCVSWASGSLSCDDLYLSVSECQVCAELAREMGP